MKIYKLKFVQKLPITVDEAWEFFSSPKNLSKITPEGIGFHITSEHADDEKVYAGQIITYIIKPVLGIPVNWMTEITHVSDKAYFVDEQRFGPYALWHHTHKFKAIPNGVEMTDTVYYALPFGILGRIAHFIFVKKKLKTIFNFRVQSLTSFFGSYKS